MRLLVVGAGGQLGSAVARLAADQGHEVWGGYLSRPPRPGPVRPVVLDKSSPPSIAEALRTSAAEAVIDTGAFHNVDACERQPAQANAVNRDGTRALARAAREQGAGYLFVSTDFVFGGAGQGPFSEEDPPAPVSVYGASKLEGELAARQEHPDAVIARTSVIFSWIPAAERRDSVSGKGLNFASWAIDELVRGRPVSIVTDQLASPTHVDDLSQAVLALSLRAPGGIYHAAGATGISRFDFTRALAQRLGWDPELVRPTTTEALHQLARRPKDSRLRSIRLVPTTGYRTWELPQALDRLAAEVAAAPPEARSGPA
jgi:dTDP-4-dehydrorhamnose reductase